MTDAERAAKIEAAIRDADALGEQWTNASIYHVVGGSTSLCKRAMARRRAQGPPPPAPGVLVDAAAPAPPPPPAPELPPPGDPGIPN